MIIMACLRLYLLLLISAFLPLANTMAQDSSRLQLSAYGELYYGYDFNRLANSERPFFLYNHKRHNAPALNLAMVKATYQNKGVRANLALMAGDYAKYNLAAEPAALRAVYEANIGILLWGKHRLWLDAGVLPSHIGFESAIGASHYTASRSMAADNSPYYETGIKLTGTNNRNTLTTSLLVLNGWQHIKRPAGVRRPSYGMQISYTPSENLTLNYSNFVGSDKPDSLHAWRFFQNIYAIATRGQWSLVAGFDLGRDRGRENRYDWWYTPVLIARRSFAKQWKGALRTEYFRDAKAALITAPQPQGFSVWGFSANFDKALGKHLLWRIEGRSLHAANPIFKEGSSRDNISLLTTVCVQW